MADSRNFEIMTMSLTLIVLTMIVYPDRVDHDLSDSVTLTVSIRSVLPLI